MSNEPSLCGDTHIHEDAPLATLYPFSSSKMDGGSREEGTMASVAPFICIVFGCSAIANCEVG